MLCYAMQKIVILLLRLLLVMIAASTAVSAVLLTAQDAQAAEAKAKAATSDDTKASRGWLSVEENRTTRRSSSKGVGQKQPGPDRKWEMTIPIVESHKPHFKTLVEVAAGS